MSDTNQSESSSPISEASDSGQSQEASDISSLLDKHFPNGVSAAPDEPAYEGEEESEERPKKQDPFSNKFAALSRKEKQQREEKMQISRERQQIAAERAEIERVKQIAASKDVKSLARELGMTVDDFMNAYLDAVEAAPADTKTENIDPTMKRLMDEIEQLKNKDIDKEIQALKREEDQTINGFKGVLKQHIDSAGDNYELIKSYGKYEDVYNVIEEYHRQHKVVLDFDEAATYVESYLEEEVDKLLQVNKIRSKFGQPKQSAPSSNESSGSNFTLTNTQATSRPTKTDGYLSKEESLDRLASKLLMK